MPLAFGPTRRAKSLPPSTPLRYLDFVSQRVQDSLAIVCGATFTLAASNANADPLRFPSLKSEQFICGDKLRLALCQPGVVRGELSDRRPIESFAAAGDDGLQPIVDQARQRHWDAKRFGRSQR